MFGRVGKQNAGHLDNLRGAIVKIRWDAAKLYTHPDHTMVLEARTRCPLIYEERFLTFLKHLGDTLDDEVKLVRSLAATRFFPEDTIRRALVTLWRMSWFHPKDPEKPCEGPRALQMSEPIFWTLFGEQDILVQRCLATILFLLGTMVSKKFEMRSDLSVWAFRLSLRLSRKEPQAHETYTQMARVIDASVLMTVMIFGIHRVFRMQRTWTDIASSHLRSCLNHVGFAATNRLETTPELDVYNQIAVKLGFRLNCLGEYDELLLEQARQGVLRAQPAQALSR